MSKLAFKIDNQVLEFTPKELKEVIKKGQLYDLAGSDQKLAERMQAVADKLADVERANKEREDRLNSILFEESEEDVAEFAHDTLVSVLTDNNLPDPKMEPK